MTTGAPWLFPRWPHYDRPTLKSLFCNETVIFLTKTSRTTQAKIKTAFKQLRDVSRIVGRERASCPARQANELTRYISGDAAIR
jgi:hypothetical protein